MRSFQIPVSNAGKNGVLYLAGNRYENESAGGEKIIFTSFIDNANIIVLFRIRVGDHWIDLPALKRHLIISIIYTDRYESLIVVRAFHDLIKVALYLHLFFSVRFIPVNLS